MFIYLNHLLYSLNCFLFYQEGEFAWPKEIQGLLLGAFFWGYLTTQIIGGWMASRFGGKRVFGYFMLVCALATLLMPVGARIDYRLLLALRIIAGLCQVSEHLTRQVSFLPSRNFLCRRMFASIVCYKLIKC